MGLPIHCAQCLPLAGGPWCIHQKDSWSSQGKQFSKHCSSMECLLPGFFLGFLSWLLSEVCSYNWSQIIILTLQIFFLGHGVYHSTQKQKVEQDDEVWLWWWVVLVHLSFFSDHHLSCLPKEECPQSTCGDALAVSSPCNDSVQLGELQGFL